MASVPEPTSEIASPAQLAPAGRTASLRAPRTYNEYAPLRVGPPGAESPAGSDLGCWIRKAGAPLLLSIAMLAFPAIARANPWDIYGFNARALGMGGAHTAASDDFTAVYYNPASLTVSPDTTFGFSMTLARPSLSLGFDREDRSIAELSPPGSDGITFGALFPLGGARFAHRVAFGIGLNVPMSSLLDGRALDPAIPHWYMYQSLPRRIVAAIGLGISPWDFISAGASVQILAGLNGHLDYELDIVAGRFSRKTVEFDIEPRAAPILGLEVRPLPGLRVGFTYRAPISSDVDLPVQLEITGIAELEVLTNFRVQYSPHELAFGASYELDPFELTLTADFTWAMWSAAPDPSVASSLDVGGSLFEGTGLGAALDAPAPGQERAVDLGFRDVVVTKLGAEKRFGPLAVRAGWALRPSPAPVQTSGTNYVDGTAHDFSVGLGYAFRDPMGALANPLILDAAAALYFLPSRRHSKIDPNDPIGSFDASGTIFVTSFGFRYQFGEGPAEADSSRDLPEGDAE